MAELHVKFSPSTQPGEKTYISTEDREAAELARNQAQAARDQAVAAVGTFTAPADTVIAGLVGDPLSATGVSVRDVVSEFEPPRVETYVADFGAVGDGVANDTAAFTAAIEAAGIGGKIIYTGVHKLGPITLLDFQTLECPFGQFLGTGPTPRARLLFSGLTGTQAGVTTAANNVFNNVVFWGPGYTGTCVGVNSPSGSPRFKSCGFYNWAVAAHLTNAYYSVFENCEWSYSAVGVKLTGCYNVNVYAPRFNLANADFTAFGTAFQGAARALNIYGGSIEQYGSAGAIAPASLQAVNLFGVYFESGQAPTPFGINAQSLDKVSISMEGCLIYLYGHSRFVTVGGSTNSSLSAHGNRFICSTASPTTPLAYVFGSSPTTDVNLSGDDFSEVQKGAYTDNAASLGSGTLVGINVRPPATYDPGNLGAREYVGRHLIASGAIRTGASATGGRPTASSLPAGSQWYDTTLNKPIWASGSSWRDAAGTVV